MQPSKRRKERERQVLPRFQVIANGEKTGRVAVAHPPRPLIGSEGHQNLTHQMSEDSRPHLPLTAVVALAAALIAQIDLPLAAHPAMDRLLASPEVTTFTRPTFARGPGGFPLGGG